MRSQSSRITAGVWLLANIVLYASYTANLVAALTIEQIKPPFNTLDEMAAQTEYKYGMKNGSAAHMLLQVILGAEMKVLFMLIHPM